MKLTDTKLNRIKIRDLMNAVYRTYDLNSGLGLTAAELMSKTEERALEHATDEDLRRIEKLYIKSTLGIEYFPTQGKKQIKIEGKTKIIPIDYHYGSENT